MIKNLSICKIIIPVFLLISSTFSQFTFVRIDPPVVFGPDTFGTQLKSHGVVRNTTSSNITLNISIINRYITPGWDSIGMCDWHNCYNPGQYNISSITPPGGYETLYVYFSPNGIQGSGHCTVRINYQSTTIDQDFAVEGNPLGIKQISSVVKDFILGQNYPNPFNPTTKIRFSIPKGGYTTLKIFDINGQELENLISGTYPQGEFEVDFNASGLASGVYYYRLSSGGEISVKKMVLVK